MDFGAIFRQTMQLVAGFFQRTHQKSRPRSNQDVGWNGGSAIFKHPNMSVHVATKVTTTGNMAFRQVQYATGKSIGVGDALL